MSNPNTKPPADCPKVSSNPRSKKQSNSSTEDAFLTPQNKAFYSSGVYSRLHYEKHEIRLLEIVGSDEKVTMRLKFHETCTISRKGVKSEYCAVSYYAGNHKDTTVIN